jgi:hypothetical protein
MNGVLPFTDQPAPTYTVSTVMMQVPCAGCASSATVGKPARPSIIGVIPDGWCACWEDAHGELLKWCAQCRYEGRHERGKV